MWNRNVSRGQDYTIKLRKMRTTPHWELVHRKNINFGISNNHVQTDEPVIMRSLCLGLQRIQKKFRILNSKVQISWVHTSERERDRNEEIKYLGW